MKKTASKQTRRANQTPPLRRQFPETQLRYRVELVGATRPLGFHSTLQPAQAQARQAAAASGKPARVVREVPTANKRGHKRGATVFQTALNAARRKPSRKRSNGLLSRAASGARKLKEKLTRKYRVIARPMLERQEFESEQGALRSGERLALKDAQKQLRKKGLPTKFFRYEVERVNPAQSKKKRANADEYSPDHPISVKRHYRSGGPDYQTKRERIIRAGQRDLFAPDATMDQLLATLRRNPTILSAVKKRLGKAFKTASPALLKKTMRSVISASRKQKQRKNSTINISARRVTVRTKNSDKLMTAAVEAYQEFHGKEPRKVVDEYAPKGSGAPKIVTVLGPIHRIFLEGKTPLKFGGRPDSPKLAEHPLTKRQLYLLGRNYQLSAGQGGVITRIEYVAKKEHLGDQVRTIYFHRMGEETGEKPRLVVNDEGLALIKGGNYRIDAAGIHN
jgi:hypothetical protein